MSESLAALRTIRRIAARRGLPSPKGKPVVLTIGAPFLNKAAGGSVVRFARLGKSAARPLNEFAAASARIRAEHTRELRRHPGTVLSTRRRCRDAWRCEPWIRESGSPRMGPEVLLLQLGPELRRPRRGEPAAADLDIEFQHEQVVRALPHDRREDPRRGCAGRPAERAAQPGGHLHGYMVGERRDHEVRAQTDGGSDRAPKAQRAEVHRQSGKYRQVRLHTGPQWFGPRTAHSSASDVTRYNALRRIRRVTTGSPTPPAPAGPSDSSARMDVIKSKRCANGGTAKTLEVHL